MTTQEVRALQIGDQIQVYVRDIFGNGFWTDATVSKILEPDIEEADEFGIWYHDPYARILGNDGEEWEVRVSEDSARFREVE